MPQYDEEMKKRRAKREAQRKAQQAQARRMKLALILAAVVLVAVIGGIVLLMENTDHLSGGETVPVPVTTQPPTPTENKSVLNQDPITTIHIRAAGDLNITDSVVKSGQSAMGYDFTNAFKDVAAILSEADLTVLNLEGNVCGEPYGTETTSAPMELLEALRRAGVDMIQTANSCSVNNGLNGLTSTLQAIRAAGLEPLGSFTSAEEYRSSGGYTIAEVRGVRIAFVAFTKGLGGRGMPAGNEDLVNLLYVDYATTYQTIDRDRINAILKAAEAEKPDITIALVHWGSEYNEDISKTQKSIVSLMQDGGVDVILGTHPHLVQPIDFNKEKGTLVAYSLGDFFGDAKRGGTNYSIILDLEITKDAATGVTKVTDFSYTPIYTVKPSDSKGDYSYSRVVRIETAIQAYYQNFLDSVTKTCKEAMDKALTRIDERVVMPTEAD